MKRRDFVAGMAGILAAGVAPDTVRSDSPMQYINANGAREHLSQHSRIVALDNPEGSLWLSYASDPNDIWLSVGVLTGVRQTLVAAETTENWFAIAE